MSDYISDNEKYSIIHRSIYGNADRFSNARYSGLLNNNVGLCDKDAGFTVPVNALEHYETSRRCYQQSDIFGQDSTLIDGNNISTSMDMSYVGELQRLSSKLIHLLNGARQRSIKVKASCGVSQRHQLEQKGKDQGGSFPSHCYTAGRQLATQSQSSLENSNYRHGDVLVEHVDNVPVGGKSAGTTISNTNAPPNGVFLRSGKTSMTNEVSMNGFSEECSATRRKDQYQDKDRQKKDMHNKIEKRRRCLINDRINELGNLLPEHINRASCQKKGSILKESIDYIKKLRKDQGRVHRLEDKMSETCDEVKKLAQRLAQLETKVTTTATNSGGTGHAYEDLDINKSLTVQPADHRQHFAPPLQEPPSDKLTTVSELLGLNQGLDDLSTTFSIDATVSLPCSVGFDINDMDCYI